MGQIIDKLRASTAYWYYQRSREMGQIIGKLRGKQWREKTIDDVFNHLKNESGRVENLTFEDIYIAVLLLFNELNKYSHGVHIDPPSKEKVRDLMKVCDINLDGELNREEFENFALLLTKETFIVITQRFILTVASAPTVALLTKQPAEGFPHVGRFLKKIPSILYATLVTLAVMMFQKPTLTIG